jgi:hypothetical protein
MTDKLNDIECAAFKLRQRHGAGAQRYAHEQAEISDRRHRDPPSAAIWRNIADAIERLCPKS